MSDLNICVLKEKSYGLKIFHRRTDAGETDPGILPHVFFFLVSNSNTVPTVYQYGFYSVGEVGFSKQRTHGEDFEGHHPGKG